MPMGQPSDIKPKKTRADMTPTLGDQPQSAESPRSDSTLLPTSDTVPSSAPEEIYPEEDTVGKVLPFEEGISQPKSQTPAESMQPTTLKQPSGRDRTQPVGGEQPGVPGQPRDRTQPVGGEQPGVPGQPRDRTQPVGGEEPGVPVQPRDRTQPVGGEQPVVP